MNTKRIILASQSPRRREILESLGIAFDSIPADIDEDPRTGEIAYYYVHRLAVEKAEKIYNSVPQSEKSRLIVIGGDLTVEFMGKIIGKQEDKSAAFATLKMLSGKVHFIRSAYSVFTGEGLHASGVNSVMVRFKDLGDAEIMHYLDNNTWEDKAGAYAIQSNGKQIIAEIEGGYYDIVGIPVFNIAAVLLNLGVEIDMVKLRELLSRDREWVTNFNGIDEVLS